MKVKGEVVRGARVVVGPFPFHELVFQIKPTCIGDLRGRNGLYVLQDCVPVVADLPDQGRCQNMTCKELKWVDAAVKVS